MWCCLKAKKIFLVLKFKTSSTKEFNKVSFKQKTNNYFSQNDLVVLLVTQGYKLMVREKKKKTINQFHQETTNKCFFTMVLSATIKNFSRNNIDQDTELDSDIYKKNR